MPATAKFNCIRCKKITPTTNTSINTAKNGRRFMKGTCGICGKTKTQFIASAAKGPPDGAQGAGLLGAAAGTALGGPVGGVLGSVLGDLFD